MAFLGFAIAAIFIGAGVAAARWLVSRFFGVRGTFREMVDTGAEASRQGAGSFFKIVGALVAYQGAFAALVLLSVAFFTGFVAKRTLPTSGNSS